MMNTSSKLSKRQQGVLTYVANFRSAHGYGPSIREIANELSINSTGTIHYHLGRLDAKGMLDFHIGIARGAVPTYQGLAEVERIQKEEQR